MPWAFVALGGALGAVARAWLGALIQGRTGPQIAWGTLAVNVLGCLLLGVLAGVAAVRPVAPDVRAGLAVGFLGAFTTFSTFGLETLQFVQHGHPERALMNVAANLGVGFLAVWVGLALGRAAGGS